MAHRVYRGDELEFQRPSWRPEERARSVIELSRSGLLKSSRANLWRYPSGACGHRHVHHVQEEVFVVLAGTLTLQVGEPAEILELPMHSIAIVEPGTPIKIANEGPDELLLFIYGAPADPSAEIIEPVRPDVKVVITSEDVR
jgi:mannose-6-phosphate isomerase-like protein (cupin superfamily)